MTWLHFIQEALHYPFMQRALLTALCTAVVCAVLSCFLVLKGWSLMGDALSHAVLPGIVLAYCLQIPLAIGAFASGMLCALLTGFLKENSRIKEDTVMGITFSGMFALGLVLFSRIDTDQHLSHILFGNVLGVTAEQLLQIAIFAGLIVAIVLVKYRDLLLYCFDPQHGQVIGLPIKWLHYGLLALLAWTIVASLQAVGVILVIALLIAPGLTALTLCRRFSSMLLVAIISSVIACISGTIISYHLDADTGACIVLIQALLFLSSQSYRLLRDRTIQYSAKPAVENSHKAADPTHIDSAHKHQ